MKKKIINLKSIVLTGTFGPIGVGSTRDEVLACLGNPFAEQCFGQSTVLVYGSYEIYYATETGVITAFQNDHLASTSSKNLKSISRRYKMDPWFIKPNVDITRSMIEEVLKKEQLLYTEKLLSGVANIVFETGVEFAFTDRSRNYSISEEGKSVKNIAVQIHDKADHVFCGFRYFPLKVKKVV